MFIMKKKEPPSSCIDSKIQSGPQDAVYSQVQLRQYAGAVKCCSLSLSFVLIKTSELHYY